MKLSEMRQILAERNLQLTRSLGQNFLHDGNQLRRITALAELAPGDRVLEIGPGLGPLTEHFLVAGARVLAVEKDARLVAVLQERFKATLATPGGDSQSPPLELLHADALHWLRDEPRDWTGWKLVSNLPYSVASPILVELAAAVRPPERVVATLQLEVVRRLVAGPGSRDYGILSLLVQMRYRPGGSFAVPRDCFFPAPDVDSGCVCLSRRPVEPLAAEERPVFVRVVKRAFSERRKKALKLLKHDWPVPVLDAVWHELALDEQVRAERITLEQFVEIARRLAPQPPAGIRLGDGQSPGVSVTEELFDVVNDRDEVVGQRPRSEVHRLGLKHRAVHVLVFNGRGELFLQKRSLTKDCFPGTWDSSASGHLAPGETYDACAVREVEEELGWRLATPPQPLFKCEACAETGQEFIWIYRAEAEGPFRLHPEEISDGGWFAPTAVAGWLAERPQDFAGAVPLIWRRLVEAGVVKVG